MMVNRPQRYGGTPEQEAANFRSHDWATTEGRCWACDARIFGLLASWPCGEKAPREDVELTPEQIAEHQARLAASALPTEGR